MKSIRFGHLLALTCFLALAACGNQDPGSNGMEHAGDTDDETAHLGQWENPSATGQNHALVFNEDGTFMMGELDAGGESMEGTYDIEYRDNVAALDLHFGNNTGLMLVDFPEANAMRAKAPNRMGGPRPTDFEPEEGMEIIIFTRKD